MLNSRYKLAEYEGGKPENWTKPRLPRLTCIQILKKIEFLGKNRKKKSILSFNVSCNRLFYRHITKKQEDKILVPSINSTSICSTRCKISSMMYLKVQLFWESHKNLRNLPHGLDIHLVKSMRKIAPIFVAFSEKLNFTFDFLLVQYN